MYSRELHIDIETFCNVSVADVGAYRYAQDESFKIILFAYAWDDGEPVVVDTYDDDYPGESIPADVWKALTDPDVLKIAHNANFEITCISTYYGIDLDASNWYCTQVGAAYLGLPLSLDKVGQVLALEQTKDAKGSALIKFFSMPCKPTKKNGGRTINRPEDDPEKWEAFKEYNAQDVRTEGEILKYLRKLPELPETERAYWVLDQEINARGVAVDLEFIRAAIALNVKALAEVRNEISDITGVDNPNSLAQLKAWLSSKGVTVASLNKDYLADVDPDLLPAAVARVLELRAAGSKTSTSKYDKMLDYVCKDGRVRGLIQFYGANRTGRFAGRGIQIQNLKRTIKGNLEVAKEAVIKGLAELLYDDVTDLISKLVRTALVAAPGKTLVVSDFAAIEARVLAWLAGEDWVLDVFRTHGKIYEATAAQMFSVPIEMVTKGSDLRAKGKVAALALGYQGGSGALISMGALREGLTEDELPAMVRRWRVANPNIVKFWRELEDVARYVIKNKTVRVLRKKYTSIKFSYERGYMFITLPSGRRLAYFGAHLEGQKIKYFGLDQVKKIWVKMDAYGGLLTENITQAVARDCLVESLYRLKDVLPLIMHIHDEIVGEIEDALAPETLETVNEIMAVSPEWAKELPLEGDGYISKYYRKD